ncbi:hypothetical protein [Duncaniella dubosii]
MEHKPYSHSLVGIVKLCTANNTVAIITVGGISRTSPKRYGN